MGLWGEYGGVWYRVAEYYYDARQPGGQQTDQEYAQRLAELAGGRAIEAVVVDPSAASFLETLRRLGGTCARRTTRCSLASGARRMPWKNGRIVICEPCQDAIREFGSYCWDLHSGDQDRCARRMTTRWTRSVTLWPRW